MAPSANVLDRLRIPVVLAPLAGGPSTPELAAAVADAGGLGFIAGGYLTAVELGEHIRAARGLTDGMLGANLFVPGPPSDPAAVGVFHARLRRFAATRHLPLGEPRHSDDDWEAKLELLRREPVPVVSFTFGCPGRAVVDVLHAAGSEVWVTVTAPDEAAVAAAAGADALVAQGAEAGGHRGSFTDRLDLPVLGLLPLLALIRRGVQLPLVASGGIADGASLAAALAAGAGGGQIGTAFMRCPEAGTSPAHRRVLAEDRDTVLTRAFTGRLARGIRNRFLDELSDGAPVAYPELHYLTSPLRRRARAQGDPELVNLWAGEAHALALEAPAAQVAAQLAADAADALGAAARRFSG